MHLRDDLCYKVIWCDLFINASCICFNIFHRDFINSKDSGLCNLQAGKIYLFIGGWEQQRRVLWNNSFEEWQAVVFHDRAFSDLLPRHLFLCDKSTGANCEVSLWSFYPIPMYVLIFFYLINTLSCRENPLIFFIRLASPINPSDRKFTP